MDELWFKGFLRQHPSRRLFQASKFKSGCNDFEEGGFRAVGYPQDFIDEEEWLSL